MSEHILNPEYIFKNALSFDHAGLMVSNFMASEKRPDYFSAQLTNSSFAIELYLKCLLLLEGKKAYGHKLYNDLFLKLSNKNKDELVEMFMGQVMIRFMPKTFPPPLNYRIPDWDLIDMLKQYDEAFVAFRYIFEEKSLKKLVGYYNPSLIKYCLRRRILDIRPEWRKWVRKEL